MNTNLDFLKETTLLQLDNNGRYVHFSVKLFCVLLQGEFPYPSSSSCGGVGVYCCLQIFPCIKKVLNLFD